MWNGHTQTEGEKERERERERDRGAEIIDMTKSEIRTLPGRI